MAESSLAVTPGSGLNLRTNTRTVSGGTVHEQGVLNAEGNAATYTLIAKNISTATAASHVVFLQADGTNYVRLRRVTIRQAAAAGAASTAALGIYRTTTIGTGGTAASARAFDSADTSPFGGTAQTLPTAKGTVTDQLLQFRFGLAATQPLTNSIEWNAREDNTKSIMFGTATTSGLALQVDTAVGTATVDVEMEFVVTSYL